ncbi:conserved exported hypothetical protein [Cupriavidus necator]|uniref:Extra-cytoplasmic solute receptor n=1 Tax=Cupriavidus necator TaxID=106590 RepID=A0A1K0JP58_CUPNE|nr:conserved exported hypothetical protein [Cupriavidus necator]
MIRNRQGAVTPISPHPSARTPSGRRKFLRLAACGAVIGTGWHTGDALAQAYPLRPVRIIVPHGAGTTPDVVARIVGQRLEARLGQPFVVENRPGAGGSIGLGAIAKAKADGYTIGMGHVGTLTINPTIYRHLPYDPIRDLTPIVLAARAPLLLVVSTATPYKSIGDIVTAAKAWPGRLTYASAGNGSASHMGAEYLKAAAGMSVSHVPFKSSGEALMSVVAGDVTMMLAGLPESRQLVKDNRLRAIALTGDRRSPDHPTIPVLSESLKDINLLNWTGFVAPQATPPDIVWLLHREISAILAEAAVQRKFQEQSLQTVPNSSEDFARFIQSELVRWKAVAKTVNLRLD